jgi:hypothetical protein
MWTLQLMKSIFFWDMTPCSALSGTRRFGGNYRLHLQGRRIVQQSSEQFLSTSWAQKFLGWLKCVDLCYLWICGRGHL